MSSFARRGDGCRTSLLKKIARMNDVVPLEREAEKRRGGRYIKDHRLLHHSAHFSTQNNSFMFSLDLVVAPFENAIPQLEMRNKRNEKSAGAYSHQRFAKQGRDIYKQPILTTRGLNDPPWIHNTVWLLTGYQCCKNLPRGYHVDTCLFEWTLRGKYIFSRLSLSMRPDRAPSILRQRRYPSFRCLQAGRPSYPALTSQ